jgi:hypothetical protein
MPLGKRIEDMAELMMLARDKKSVIRKNWKKPRPAAFVINSNAALLYQQLTWDGIFIYSDREVPQTPKPVALVVDWHDRYEKEHDKRLIAEGELAQYKGAYAMLVDAYVELEYGTRMRHEEIHERYLFRARNS